MKVISYARYSTDRQTEASIADQKRICRAFAEGRGWQVTDEFMDEGISGAALGNRPGANSALSSLGSGDVLVVVELSRLSRSQDLAPLLSRVRHRGGRVMGAQDGFDSDARTARMQAGLSGIMSEEFRMMVADRTRSALDMNARLGKPTGGKALEDPDLVREIFTRFGAGESMRAIASDLNRRGVPSPGATWKAKSRRPRGTWQISALHALLHNERYAGELIWNRSQWVRDPDTGKRHRRERPRSEWIVRQIPRLIDEETWSRVQARFTTRREFGSTVRGILSGVLECALCGGKMIITGGSQRRYICGTFHGGGGHACSNSSSFPRASAEEAVLAPVMDDLLSPGAVEAAVQGMREARLQPLPQQQPADQEVSALERLVRDGVLTAETAAPALVEARRKAQERRRSEPVQAERPWPSERAWRELVRGMREILQGEDIPAAREILMRLIGPIRCQPAKEGFVVAELTTRHVLIAAARMRGTGTDGGDWYSASKQAPATNVYTSSIAVLIPVSSKRGGRKP